MSLNEFGLERLPATVGNMNLIAHLFRAVVHGDTDRDFDVEFPSVKHLLTFMTTNIDEWRFELREPFTAEGISDLKDKPITITILKDI